MLFINKYKKISHQILKNTPNFAINQSNKLVTCIQLICYCSSAAVLLVEAA